MKLIMNDRNAKRIISKGSDVIDMRSETYKAWALFNFAELLKFIILELIYKHLMPKGDIPINYHFKTILI